VPVGGRKCSDITKKDICDVSVKRFGVHCFWGGSTCLPTVKFTPVGPIRMGPEDSSSTDTSTETGSTVVVVTSAPIPAVGHAAADAVTEPTTAPTFLETTAQQELSLP